MALTSLQAADVGKLARTLGLDKWQMQAASWNGYPFSIVNGILNGGLLTSGLGVTSTVVSAALKISDATKRVFGNSEDTAIPAGANMSIMTSIDNFKRRLAINSLPNGKDNIRGLGYQGQEIILYGMSWGPNYQGAMKNNLQNMFFSDESMSPSDPNYHVLIHPFWGRINGVWLADMRIIHQSNQWRACVYELRFITERPIGRQSIVTSFTQVLNNSISAVLATATNITTIWNNLQIAFGASQQFKPFRNNVILQNRVQNMQAPILEANNNAINAIQILTTNLSPTGYNNVSLNKYPVTTPTIPQFSYFKTHYTPQDISNLINVLTANINQAIESIFENGDNYYNDSINLLQALISQVSSYASILLQNYYGQVQEYKIPYDMSLFTACFLNNIDYESNYAKIIALNQSRFFWMNKLTAGLPLLLPLGNI